MALFLTSLLGCIVLGVVSGWVAFWIAVGNGASVAVAGVVAGVIGLIACGTTFHAAMESA